jgi:probable HAF family extracellular repeat protein
MTTDSVSVLLRYEESNMKLRTLICIIAGVAALMALALPAQLSAQQPRYKIVDLGTLGGPNSFIDCCGVQPVLNNRGTIVGGAETSVPNPNFNLSPTESFLCGSPDPLVNPAFKWEKGVLTNLGTLPGGYNSFAAFVSESDLIAGTSETGLTDPLLGGPQCHPTLWADGQIIDLGTLGGYQGVALESNNGGQVVGVATNKVPDSFLGLFANTVPSGFQPGTEQRAFLWERGMILDLGTLGGPDAAAALINDRGQIAGVSYTNSTVNASTGIPTQDPFLWEQGRIQDLGSLGGTFGFPSDLNSRGEVVGVMNLAGDVNFHGFLWDRGVRTDLGTLGGNDSEAFSINAGGQVVGTADVTGSLTHHAFLWKNGGTHSLVEKVFQANAWRPLGKVANEIGAEIVSLRIPRKTKPLTCYRLTCVLRITPREQRLPEIPQGPIRYSGRMCGATPIADQFRIGTEKRACIDWSGQLPGGRLTGN